MSRELNQGIYLISNHILEYQGFHKAFILEASLFSRIEPEAIVFRTENNRHFYHAAPFMNSIWLRS